MLKFPPTYIPIHPSYEILYPLPSQQTCLTHQRTCALLQIHTSMSFPFVNFLGQAMGLFQKPKAHADSEQLQVPTVNVLPCTPTRASFDEHFTPSKPIPIIAPLKPVCQPLPLYDAAPPMRRTQVLQTAQSECAIGSYESSDDEASPQSTLPSSSASSVDTAATSIATQYNADVILQESLSPQKKKSSSISSRRSSPSKSVRPPLIVVAVPKSPKQGRAPSAASNEHAIFSDNLAHISPDFVDPKKETRAAETMLAIEAQKVRAEKRLSEKKKYYSACLVISNQTNRTPPNLHQQAKEIEDLQKRVAALKEQHSVAVEEHAEAAGQLLYVSRKAFRCDEREIW